MSVCDNIELPLEKLALQKCEPSAALDFKDAGKNMTMHEGIFWEKCRIK